MNIEKREVWIDNVKVIACFLVVLGHFYQSMVKSDLAADSFFYNWFNDTVYYFHVPLFFICSGYLYQKYSKVSSFIAWKNNIIKKLIALGVPYFVFSLLTWILKKVFSSSVNSQIGGLFDTLFIRPASPYWYLYILFIIFFITFNTRNLKQQILLVLVSGTLKVLSCFDINTGVYCVDKTMENWIWFVLGMMLTYEVIRLCNAYVGSILLVVFLVCSTLAEHKILLGHLTGFVLGLTACYSIIGIVYLFFKDGIQNKYWQFCAKYTMPVFLMHTLFAAPLRSVLIKVGINNIIVHVASGILISFIGPVIAMIILEKIKPLDFIVYPTRYVKLPKKAQDQKM